MHGSSSIHAVLLLAALALPLATAQPWPVCDTRSGNYSAGSTYEANLLDIITALRGNAANSSDLFAAVSVGAAPNTVYGLMLCRADITASDCFDCGTLASYC